MSFSNNETLLPNNTQLPSTVITVLDQVIKIKFFYQLPLIITALGLIGFIGNAFTILQPILRYNTFCIYTLCGSLVDIINILINLLPNNVGSLKENLIPSITNSFLCKLKIFSFTFLPQLSMNLLIMSLIDRYACTYDLTSPMRRLLKLKTVPWLIGMTVIISCLMTIHVAILNNVISGFGCGSTYLMLSSILYILIHRILTPVTMLVIGLLTYRKFKENRQRVGIAILIKTNRFQNQFITMVFVQAFITSFFALQWIGTYWYFVATLYQYKNAKESAITCFILILANNLYYVINAKSFYLSILTSRLFRNTFKNALWKLLPECFHQC